MDLEIRTITEDEFAEWVGSMERAFGGTPSPEDIAFERSVTELDRAYGAFDGGRIVGNAAAFTMPMTVPGGDVSVGYVTGVGVSPTHRRRGINSTLMTTLLENAHDRGEAIDVLYASEGGIYGRFGYGLASFGLAFDIDTHRSAFVRGYEPSGTVDLVERSDAVEPILAAHRAIRLEIPGMTELDAVRFDYVLRDHGPDRDSPYFFALHDAGGAVDGWAIYRIRHDWSQGVPNSTLQLRDLQAADAGAYADLWRFLFDVDLVSHVQGAGRRVDEPLLHRLREPRRFRGTIRDGLWLRLVDVAAALEARRYSAPGGIVLEVTDPVCPWNDGRWALEVADDGTARCSRTDDDATIASSVSELGAAYLGGASFRRLARAGLVEERSAGALAAADRLFTWDPAPWSPYVF
jgi:predicted acetyltransferase